MASDDSSYINGTDFMVDGGLSSCYVVGCSLAELTLDPHWLQPAAPSQGPASRLVHSAVLRNHAHVVVLDRPTCMISEAALAAFILAAASLVAPRLFKTMVYSEAQFLGAGWKHEEFPELKNDMILRAAKGASGRCCADCRREDGACASVDHETSGQIPPRWVSAVLADFRIPRGPQVALVLRVLPDAIDRFRAYPSAY